MFEYKRHFIFSGAEQVYIEEQNYSGNGVVFGLEYYKYKGMLLSFEAGYTWRRYPDAVVEAVGSFYTDRNVLNLNLLFQFPVTDNINFNIFASYDNDQDLDSDAGNTRSSIFSAEFQYKF